MTEVANAASNAALMSDAMTLLAANPIVRNCRGMELDPRDVETSFSRCQNFTGLDAARVLDGGVSVRE